jgi:hypothetical protein
MAKTITINDLRERAKILKAESKKLGRPNDLAGRAPSPKEFEASLRAQLLAEELESLANKLEG